MEIKDEKSLEFIQKYIEKFGDRFDYSRVVYKNSKTKVEIECKKHGVFLQEPHQHLIHIHGCPKCAKEFSSNLARQSQEDFINRISKNYIDKLDFSKIVYRNIRTKVIVTCKIHEIEFETLPRNLIIGKFSCSKCSIDFISQNKNEKFIIKSKKKFGDKFSYSKTTYIHSHERVILTCNTHGDFSTIIATHLNSNFGGCFKCSNEYKSNKYKIPIDVFLERAYQIHGDKYDYSKMVYKKYTAKVDIICLEHGIFSKTPYDHIKFGYECPRCNNQASKPCDDWLNSLKNSNINREYQLSNNKRIFVDGYDVTTNTIYQFHGKYWHGDYRVHDAKEYDFRRKMYFGDIYAKTLLNDFQLLCWGYNLIVMWEYDWNKFKKITRKEVI